MSIRARPLQPSWAGSTALTLLWPFLSRAAAEKFMNDSLDFFKMRRCVNDLASRPQVSGCIYSEMKMCSGALFQRAASDEEYKQRVGRVQDYFDSGGESLVRQLPDNARPRRQISILKTPAALHTRIEKLKPVLGLLPEIVIARSDACRHDPTWAAADRRVLPHLSWLYAGPTHFPSRPLNTQKSQSMEMAGAASLIPFRPRGEIRT